MNSQDILDTTITNTNVITQYVVTIPTVHNIVVIIYNAQSQVCVYLLARDPVSLLHHHYFLQTWVMVAAILVNSFQ